MVHLLCPVLFSFAHENKTKKQRPVSTGSESRPSDAFFESGLFSHDAFERIFSSFGFQEDWRRGSRRNLVVCKMSVTREYEMFVLGGGYACVHICLLVAADNGDINQKKNHRGDAKEN